MTIAYTRNTQDKGFTLIELLVVIAIIGVLAAVVLLAINPAELLRRSRDSTRMSDLATIRKAIDAAVAQQNTVIALPCTGGCNSSERDRTVAGAGWIGATGGTFTLAAYMSTLPVDPTNAATTVACNSAVGAVTCTANRTTGNVNAYYYFTSDSSGGYELATYLESTANITKLNGDGGDDANMFETGTDPALDLI